MTLALLWDLDGTLLSTARAGILALEDASREVLGIDADLSGMRTSGLTDAAVAELAIETAGATPSEGLIASFLATYEERLPGRLPERRGFVMPNVGEILGRLDARDDVVSLLLTGNTARGAAAKLSHYGLNGYFRGEGAYCVDGRPRADIARQARDLVAARLGEQPLPARMLVIGDTPHDIEAGDAIGARTLAVATGTHSRAELESHNPWVALDELPAPAEFEALVGLGGDRCARIRSDPDEP